MKISVRKYCTDSTDSTNSKKKDNNNSKKVYKTEQNWCDWEQNSLILREYTRKRSVSQKE